MIKSKGVVFCLSQRFGRRSEVVGAVSEGAEFGLQGAALRVVLVKPAGTSFNGGRIHGLLLGVPPGRLHVPPVSDVHPASFHWKQEDETSSE